jgi:hypothetical protein
MHGSAKRHYLHVNDFRNAGSNLLKQGASKPWHIALSVCKVDVLRKVFQRNHNAKLIANNSYL